MSAQRLLGHFFFFYGPATVYTLGDGKADEFRSLDRAQKPQDAEGPLPMIHRLPKYSMEVNLFV